MKKLSAFDLGAIIAFAVLALAGIGAWWYLSGELAGEQSDVATAKAAFDKSSTKYNIVVSRTNGKTLQSNIDLLKGQLGPLIQDKLVPKENLLPTIDREDPVAWKHDLDDEVHRLTTAAKLHGVALPPNFYFGFGRYLSQSPNDEQTAVLNKQLLGIEQIATILIDAPVKNIDAIRRTYEEDVHTNGGNSFGPTGEDHLGGYSLNAPAVAYTAYPFEVDFETTAENLRSVVNNLIRPPYILVLRTLSIQNSNNTSPLINDLQRMAGPPPAPYTDMSPGEVAAAPSTKGPQFLFGNSNLRIKARIDLIEWKAKGN